MASIPIEETATLVADADTVLYTVPAGKFASVDLNVSANSGVASAGSINVVVSPDDTVAAGKVVEVGVPYSAPGLVLLRTDMTLVAGNRLIVKATTADIEVRLSGHEEDV